MAAQLQIRSWPTRNLSLLLAALPQHSTATQLWWPSLGDLLAVSSLWNCDLRHSSANQHLSGFVLFRYRINHRSRNIAIHFLVLLFFVLNPKSVKLLITRVVKNTRWVAWSAFVDFRKGNKSNAAAKARMASANNPHWGPRSESHVWRPPSGDKERRPTSGTRSEQKEPTSKTRWSHYGLKKNK